MYHQIKNIIFDLGGVILNIEPQLSYNAFRKLGISDFENIYTPVKQTELFDRFERGHISPAEFREEIKKAFNIPATYKQIDDAWNAILMDIPHNRIEMLQQIKCNYRLFLLSNTNEIHHASFHDNIVKNYKKDIFSEIFERTYYSFEMGIKKPDKRIFEKVLTENCLKPEETLFIDDSYKHIAAAKELGIKCFFLENTEVSVLFKNGKLSAADNQIL